MSSAIEYTYNIDIDNLVLSISKSENGQMIQNFIFHENENKIPFTSPNEIHIFAAEKIAQFEKSDITADSLTNTAPVSKYAFLTSFTLTELKSLYTAAATDITVQIIMKLFDAAQDILLSDPQTQEAFAYFVMEGLLTEERVKEIQQTMLQKANATTSSSGT